MHNFALNNLQSTSAEGALYKQGNALRPKLYKRRKARPTTLRHDERTDEA